MLILLKHLINVGVFLWLKMLLYPVLYLFFLLVLLVKSVEQKNEFGRKIKKNVKSVEQKNVENVEQNKILHFTTYITFFIKIDSNFYKTNRFISYYDHY